MYRARADDVAGTRVYADGKWLRCIGNKNVSAGDRVWTDGRCVYGNEPEAQQPQVIIAPPIMGIPIVISKEADNTVDYCTYSLKGTRKKVESKNTVDNRYFVNDKRLFVYAGELYLASKFFTEGDSDAPFHGGIHDFHFSYTVGANIDKLGNIYELREKHVDSEAPTAVNPLGGAHTSKLELQIIKNDETVSVCDLSNYLKQTVDEAIAKIGGFFTGEPPSGYLLGSRCYTWIFTRHGVIENEKDWAYMVEIGAYADTCRPRPGTPDLGPRNYTGQMFTAIKTILCLCTPDGDKRIVDIGFYSVEFDLQEEICYEHDISPPNDKIPIQDGYYFKINSLEESQNYGTVDAENISIYSPDDEEIFRDDFPIGTYLTIYKGRLLGVDNSRWKLVDQKIDDVGVDGGLYSIKNKKLTTLAEGVVRNWKLRPMKRHKKWQDRIKKFPPELNETE